MAKVFSKSFDKYFPELGTVVKWDVKVYDNKSSDLYNSNVDELELEANVDIFGERNKFNWWVENVFPSNKPINFNKSFNEFTAMIASLQTMLDTISDSVLNARYKQEGSKNELEDLFKEPKENGKKKSRKAKKVV